MDHQHDQAEASASDGRQSRVTELAVAGMTCTNCARHVTEAIQRVPGVHSATVNLVAHRANVRWAGAAEQNTSALIKAIEQEGFAAKVLEPSAHAQDHGEHRLPGWQFNLWI